MELVIPWSPERAERDEPGGASARRGSASESPRVASFISGRRMGVGQAREAREREWGCRGGGRGRGEGGTQGEEEEEKGREKEEIGEWKEERMRARERQR